MWWRGDPSSSSNIDWWLGGNVYTCKYIRTRLSSVYRSFFKFTFHILSHFTVEHDALRGEIGQSHRLVKLYNLWWLYFYFLFLAGKSQLHKCKSVHIFFRGGGGGGSYHCFPATLNHLKANIDICIQCQYQNISKLNLVF